MSYFIRSCQSRVQYIYRPLDRFISRMASRDTLPPIYVRCLPHEEKMTAHFDMKLPSGEDRTFELNRKVMEPVSVTLARLATNIFNRSSTSSEKKSKKRVCHENIKDQSRVQIYDRSGDVINPDLHNCHAWAQGGVMAIFLNDTELRYRIEVNAPTITSLTLPGIIMSGFTAHPYMTCEFTELDNCEFIWLRLINDEEVVVGSEETYTPGMDDVGYKLKMLVRPRLGERVGEAMTAVTSDVTKRGPENCPFETRQVYTKSLSGKDRLVTYNILAEVYTDSDYSRDELFAHCPADYIFYDYRKQLILKEILGYHADIICLQEVDRKHFEKYYQPIMHRKGFQSSMLTKSHKRLPQSTSSESLTDGGAPPTIITINEGSAIFFRTSKLRQIAHHNINIAETIETHPLYADLMKAAESSSMVREKLLYRSGASLQVVVLESLEDPHKRVCVATTHLYFHPDGTIIRLLQSAVATRFLQYIRNIYRTEKSLLPIVFCGDFNTTPDKQVVKYLLNGKINATDSVWKMNAAYSMPGIDLHHLMDLGSACGFPKYTNYVPEFQACLDYIFYDKALLKVRSIVNPPPTEVLEAQNGGLPSEVFPSDHIPLICDLSWNDQ